MTNSSQPENLPTTVTRCELLTYLLTRRSTWYSQQRICCTCSIRLCKWAGNLGPIFPSQQPHQRQTAASVRLLTAGAAHARQRAAQLVSKGVVTRPLSYAVRNLLNKAHSVDPHPAAVAVIEDLPAKEFLFTRGNYCLNTSPGLFDDVGMCCGGHAFDLVLTHRDLLRHSLCRPCLQAFWRWANGNVDWWTWLEPLHTDVSSSLPSCSLDHKEVSIRVYFL